MAKWMVIGVDRRTATPANFVATVDSEAEARAVAEVRGVVVECVEPVREAPSPALPRDDRPSQIAPTVIAVVGWVVFLIGAAPIWDGEPATTTLRVFLVIGLIITVIGIAMFVANRLRLTTGDGR